MLGRRGGREEGREGWDGGREGGREDWEGGREGGRRGRRGRKDVARCTIDVVMSMWYCHFLSVQFCKLVHFRLVATVVLCCVPLNCTLKNI